MANDSLKFCKNILSDVSRSFALTIPMLDEKLKNPVMITYLQDRLLDNFEDEGENIPSEHRKYLMDLVVEVFNPDNKDPGRPIREIEENAHLIPDKSLRKLTENTHLLYRAYETLEEQVKIFSHHWLVEMNEGMKKYLDYEIKTFAELDEYCYYVAGTVGGFLTDIILLEGDVPEKDKEKLLNNFVDAGLFLQKVNLVRDIKKDIKKRNKNFWPLQSLKLTEDMLLNPDHRLKVMKGLTRMIDNIKQHIDGLIEYMEALPAEFPGYKRFFCVNNALGLATLEEMEDNPEIFYGGAKVKVSRFTFLNILKSPQEYFLTKSRNYSKFSVNSQF